MQVEEKQLAGEALPPSKALTGPASPGARSARPNRCRFHSTADRRRNSMKRFFSLRRVAFALALLGILGLAGGLPAAETARYQASGSFTFTGKSSGTLEGKSTPGGPYSGTFVQKASHGGDHLEGVAEFNYNNGSLTISYVLDFDDSLGVFVGSYVVIDGSGVWDGGYGDGDLMADRGQTGSIALSGTISR